MDNNLEFPNGLIFKLPRNGAPEFVKGSLSIKRAELIEWLNSKSDEWINLDLKVGQSGKAYASVNTFKPDSTSVKNAQVKGGIEKNFMNDAIDSMVDSQDDGLPF
jgi:hypothetical protein